MAGLNVIACYVCKHQTKKATILDGKIIVDTNLYIHPKRYCTMSHTDRHKTDKH